MGQTRKAARLWRGLAIVVVLAVLVILVVQSLVILQLRKDVRSQAEALAAQDVIATRLSALEGALADVESDLSVMRTRLADAQADIADFVTFRSDTLEWAATVNDSFEIVASAISAVRNQTVNLSCYGSAYSTGYSTYLSCTG